MKRPLLVLLILFVVVVLFVLFLFSGDKFMWAETFRIKDKEPYDFGIFHDLINQQSQGKVIEIKDDFDSPMDKLIQDSSDQIYTYVYCARYPELYSDEIAKLIEFVSKGNQVIFLSRSIPDTLLEVITGYKYNYGVINYSYLDSIKYAFNHGDMDFNKEHKYAFYYKDRVRSYSYATFNTNQHSLSSNYIPLVRDINNPYKVVYLSQKIGTGNFFYHLELLPFTNYYMIQEEGFEYVSKVIAHLKPSTFVWDYGLKRQRKRTRTESFMRQSDSPIDFITKNRELAFAWYLLLISSVLFLIFGTKRLQTPIPVVKYRKNSSLEFVETISSLYKQKGAYKQLALIKMNHFLWYLRNKIGVSTHKLNKETAEKVAKKTGISADTVILIFEHYERNIQGQVDIADTVLISLNSKIQKFHNELKNEQRRKQNRRI